MGYSYAGVQYSDYCYCGNSYGLHGVSPSPSTDCNMRARGNPSQYGGGSYKNSIYRTFAHQVNNYIGCFGPGYLPYAAASVGSWGGQPGRNQYLTPTMCINACSMAGYAYSAIQYATYCWCGNSYSGLPTLPVSSCNMGCGGQTGTMCGGPNANSIWYTNGNGPSSWTGQSYGYGRGATQDASLYALSAALWYTQNNNYVYGDAYYAAYLWHSGRTVAQGTLPAAIGWVSSSDTREANSYESSGMANSKRNPTDYYTYFITASNNAPAMIGEYPALPALAHAFA